MHGVLARKFAPENRYSGRRTRSILRDSTKRKRDNMNVHILQHDPWVKPGAYLPWAKERGYGAAITRLWEYEPLPEGTDFDMLVILGGHQCPATTREECDYFDAAAETRFIRAAVAAGKMVIGSCLGAQLIGDALGGTFSHSPEREVGPALLTLTDEGRSDPFLSAYPASFTAMEWHNDMAGLSDGAAVLAASEGCPHQIVRYGTFVYGFQPHMEFTKEIISEGIRATAGRPKQPGRFVHPDEELLAFDPSEMNRLLWAFLDAMAGAWRKTI